MKKLSVILGVFILILLFNAVAFANYKENLYNSANYPLCDAHMGIAWYANLNSLQIKQYKPPIYKISVKVLCVNADEGYKVEDTKWYHFKYNYSNQEMYILRNGKWACIPRDGCWADSGVIQPIGEIIFEKAYNIPFYI